MTLVACVDNGLGLQFNSRRQSQDRVLRKKLLDMVDSRLLMNPYSAKMFGFHEKIMVSDRFLSDAGPDDWVFIEDESYISYAEKIEKIVLFRWNRDYPRDLYFTFPGQWHLVSQEDFSGNSHENITMEMYQR